MPHFMKPDIRVRQAGAMIETHAGTYYVPSEVYNGLQLVAPTMTEDELYDFAHGDLVDYVPYTFGYADVTLVTGYFGRYSAPGYMDCTEWHFNTNRAALLAELAELYGDDDDDDDDAEPDA